MSVPWYWIDCVSLPRKITFSYHDLPDFFFFFFLRKRISLLFKREGNFADFYFFFSFWSVSGSSVTVISSVSHLRFFSVVSRWVTVRQSFFTFFFFSWVEEGQTNIFSSRCSLSLDSRLYLQFSKLGAQLGVESLLVLIFWVYIWFPCCSSCSSFSSFFPASSCVSLRSEHDSLVFLREIKRQNLKKSSLSLICSLKSESKSASLCFTNFSSLTVKKE